MLQAASLQSLPGIRHAFFTREGGVSGGVYESLNGGIGSRDAAAHVAENRALMARAVGVRPENFLTAYQIHSPEVVTVEQLWTPDTRPHADALVTRVPGLAVGVSTADCGPILFADAGARVIGAAHAGWRGALTGVIVAILMVFFRDTMNAVNLEHGLTASLGEGGYMILGTLFFAGMMVMLYRLAKK